MKRLLANNTSIVIILLVGIVSVALTLTILSINRLQVDKEQIILAIYNADANEVERIITEHRSIVNTVFDENGSSLLSIAISSNNNSRENDVINFLIKSGADVNAKDYYGGQPIGVAIYNKDYTTYMLLLKSGVTISTPDNYIAAATRAGNIYILKDIVLRGANVNLYESNGMAPLHYAPNAAVAEYLIAKGADINAKDKYVTTGGVDLNTTIVDDGATPLHMAINNYKVDVVQTLLAHGADKTIVNRQGLTPRELAVRLGYNDIVEMLDKQ